MPKGRLPDLPTRIYVRTKALPPLHIPMSNTPPRPVTDRARIVSPDVPQICRVPGCTRPTQRAAGNGLSASYCKSHVNHYARHGSYWLGSLKGSDLAPYRKSARQWVKQHREDRSTALHLHQLDALLSVGTDVAHGVALKGQPAIGKARVTLGRLRAAGVTGEQLLEVALGVATALGVRGAFGMEYLEVQIAKVLMRMHAPTAGTQWRPSESRARATGRGLRVLGHHVWWLSHFVADHAVLVEIARAAQPRIAVAQKAEERRQAKARVRRSTEAAIERNIKRAREYGMGPAELGEMRAALRRKHGLE